MRCKLGARRSPPQYLHHSTYTCEAYLEVLQTGKFSSYRCVELGDAGTGNNERGRLPSMADDVHVLETTRITVANLNRQESITRAADVHFDESTLERLFGCFCADV